MSHNCKFCGKSFSKNSQLETHVRSHTGEKPFICTYFECGKGFTRSDHLAKHLCTHTGERKYTCEADCCMKRFTTSSQLKRHSKTHDNSFPYSCSICVESFSKKSHLRAHRLELHNISEFICMQDNCRKMFPSQSKLERHISTHKKQYMCCEPGCFIMMASYNALRRHTSLEHGSSHNNSISSSSAEATSQKLVDLNSWSENVFDMSSDDEEEEENGIQAPDASRNNSFCAVKKFSTKHELLHSSQYCLQVLKEFDPVAQRKASQSATFRSSSGSTFTATTLENSCTGREILSSKRLRSGEKIKNTIHGEGIGLQRLKSVLYAAELDDPNASSSSSSSSNEEEEEKDDKAHRIDRAGELRDEDEAVDDVDDDESESMKSSAERYLCSRVGCGRSFAQARNLAAHMKAVHTVEPRFVCTEAGCGQKFGWKAVMLRHVKNIHQQGKRRRVPVKPYRMGRDGSAQSFREHDEQDDLLDVLATVENLDHQHEGRVRSHSTGGDSDSDVTRGLWDCLLFGARPVGSSMSIRV